jgi:hypothetical protein
MSVKTRKKPALAATVVALLASIALVSLSIQPMKAAYYDCGTIFASADTWWYDGTGAPDGEYSGLEPDAATHEACAAQHERRLVTLLLVGALAVVAAGTAGVLWRRPQTPGTVT